MEKSKAAEAARDLNGNSPKWWEGHAKALDFSADTVPDYQGSEDVTLSLIPSLTVRLSEFIAIILQFNEKFIIENFFNMSLSWWVDWNFFPLKHKNEEK